MQPLSKRGIELYQNAHERFYSRLPHLLAEPLRDLDTTLVVALMRRHDVSPSLQLSVEDWRDLHTFAHANLGLETVIVPLWQLAHHHVVAQLSLQQKTLLVSRVLQRNSWAEVCRVSGYNGKNEAIKALRQSVAFLLELRRSGSP